MQYGQEYPSRIEMRFVCLYTFNYTFNSRRNSVMKRTGGIIATILTSIFLGIPGLILGIMGMIAVFVPSAQSQADRQIGSLVLLIGGACAPSHPDHCGSYITPQKEITGTSYSHFSSSIFPSSHHSSVNIYSGPTSCTG